MTIKFFSFFTILLIISIKINSQNLIPNPSFENYTSCPTTNGQISQAVPWINATPSQSDYFNQCNGGVFYSVPYNYWGYQQARTGDGYAGLLVYHNWSQQWPSTREYIEVPLKSNLVANKCYKFEMYVSSATIYVTDDIGIYFSQGQVTGAGNTYDTLPLQPQIINSSGNILKDTSGWTLISGIYNASGGENYITIGNFRGDNTTTIEYLVSPNFVSTFPPYIYYYIDDIYLEEIQPATSFLDSISLCDDNSITLDAGNEGSYYEWSTGETSKNILVNQPGTYWVKTTSKCGSKIDTTIVSREYCNIYVPNAFSPNGDGLNDVFNVSAYRIENFEMKIYNRWGEVVFASENTNSGWNGSCNNIFIQSGIYCWTISYKTFGNNTNSQHLFGNLTLIR